MGLIDASQRIGRESLRHRNYVVLLLTYRHGLRASEAVGLKWDAVMLGDRAITIHRAKHGKSGLHPLKPDEVYALEILRETYPDSRFLFPTERGDHMTTAGLTKLVERCSDAAQLGIKVHPHMLRHACGYHLANQGLDTRLIQVWMGHRDIKNTERYTELNTERFKAIAW